MSANKASGHSILWHAITFNHHSPGAQCTFCRDGKGRSQQVELSQPFPGLARFMVETFPPGTDDGIEANPDCDL